MSLYKRFEKSGYYQVLKSIRPFQETKRFFHKKLISQVWELHGDIILRQMFDILVKKYNPTSIVETGTYMGYTSGYLAKRFPQIPIYTCEVNEGFYEKAKKNLAKFENVKVIHGSSDKILNDLIDQNILGERPLFYLDAHWENFWPLEKEIKIIAERLNSAIISIDDFKINGDDRFRYDKYGDQECSLDRVIPNTNAENKYNLLFPNYGPEEAFRKGINHSPLTGYPIIFQNLPEFFGKIKDIEFVNANFIDKSSFMKYRRKITGEKTNLKDVLLLKPGVFMDHRGSYTEIYNKKNYNEIFKANGIPDIEFIQDDISVSKKHVLRGFHGDNQTWKLVCCSRGEIYTVILNCDEDSPDFGKWQAFTLSGENMHQLLIPPKYGNSYLVMSEDAVYNYKQTTNYNLADLPQFTYKWNDPRFNVKWPVENPVLSKRDHLD